MINLGTIIAFLCSRTLTCPAPAAEVLAKECPHWTHTQDTWTGFFVLDNTRWTPPITDAIDACVIFNNSTRYSICVNTEVCIHFFTCCQ